jgi:hypothetical protein
MTKGNFEGKNKRRKTEKVDRKYISDIASTYLIKIQVGKERGGESIPPPIFKRKCERKGKRQSKEQ